MESRYGSSKTIVFLTIADSYQRGIIVAIPEKKSGSYTTGLYQIKTGFDALPSPSEVRNLDVGDAMRILGTIQQAWWQNLLDDHAGTPSENWDFPEWSSPKPEAGFQWLYAYPRYLAFEFAGGAAIESIARCWELPYADLQREGAGKRWHSATEAIAAIVQVHVPKSPLRIHPSDDEYSGIRIGDRGLVMVPVDAVQRGAASARELATIWGQGSVVGRLVGRLRAAPLALVQIGTNAPGLGLALAPSKAEVGQHLTLLGSYDGSPYISECLVSQVRIDPACGTEMLVLSGASVETAIGGALINSDGYLQAVLVAERYTCDDQSYRPIPERTPGVMFAFDLGSGSGGDIPGPWIRRYGTDRAVLLRPVT